MKRTYASLREHYHQSFSWKWVKAFWPVYAFCFLCILLAYGCLVWLWLCLLQPDLGDNITYFPISENPLFLPLGYFIFALEIFNDVFHFLIVQSAVYIGYYWYKKKHDYALQALAYTVMIAIIDFVYWGGATFVFTQITKLAVCPGYSFSTFISFFTLECSGGAPVWQVLFKT